MGTMDYIEISVPRYPFAISCEGKYYKRSGSTLRELNGFELQNFLLERAGKTWDAVPLPGVGVEDLSREVLLNAVNHKSYETGIPIQIRVYDDKITVWNDGKWPEQLDVSKVYERHPSLPHNPRMADVFYRSGEIESWGSGFDKIRMECDRENAPYPAIHANPKGGVELECDACGLYMKLFRHGRYYGTCLQEEKGKGSEVLPERDGAALKADVRSAGQQRSIDRMMEILSAELSPSEKEKLLPIAEYLKTHDSVTRKQAEQLTGKALSTASRYLRRLEQLGVLAADGKSVATVYRRK